MYIIKVLKRSFKFCNENKKRIGKITFEKLITPRSCRSYLLFLSGSLGTRSFSEFCRDQEKVRKAQGNGRVRGTMRWSHTNPRRLIYVRFGPQSARSKGLKAEKSRRPAFKGKRTCASRLGESARVFEFTQQLALHSSRLRNFILNGTNAFRSIVEPL